VHVWQDARNVSSTSYIYVESPKLINVVGVLSASCKEKSVVTSKLGAELVLRAVLGIPISLDDVPEQGDLNNPETIVPASTVPSRVYIEIEKD
jgi:hypothetical protein